MSQLGLGAMGLLCVLSAWVAIMWGLVGIFPAHQGCHRPIVCKYVVCGSCALESWDRQCPPALPISPLHSRLGGSSSAPGKN